MPKISIIVPVFNTEAFLERCLDSLLSQTYDDVEIICINDCSPDNSASILKRYEEDYPNKVRVLTNERNLGLGLTREHGLEHVATDYVMFVDSDDYVARDYVERYVGALRDHEADIVVGGYIRDVEGKLTTYLMQDNDWAISTYSISCAKLYKMSFIRENNLRFADFTCGEDIYFSMCAYCCDPTYVVIPYAGYYYYFNRNSITGSMNYKKNHERIMSSIFDALLSRYDIQSMPIERQYVIQYDYFSNMVNALIVFNRKCGIELMREKYDFFVSDLKAKFPNYRENPFLRIGGAKGQKRRIAMGVSVVYALMRLHLAKPAFYIVAVV